MKRDNLQCCRPTVMITSLQIPRHHRSLASRNHFPSRPIAETWLGYSLYVALSVLSYLDKQADSEQRSNASHELARGRQLRSTIGRSSSNTSNRLFGIEKLSTRRTP